MLSPQQGQIEEALRRGGLGSDAATEVATAIASCAISLVHRAIMQLDYTPKKFRFITPDLRRFSFPGVDAPIGNPDFRPPSIPTSEGMPTPDGTPREPKDARPPFGPSQDPYDPPENPNPGGGGGSGGSGGQDQGMGTMRLVRVVTNVRYNRTKKRTEVEYADIWAFFHQVLAPQELRGPKLEVLTDLRVEDANKLYGDTVKISVLSMGDVNKGAVVIEGASCGETPSVNPDDPGYNPGGL
jgi:hypothetical protein